MNVEIRNEAHHDIAEGVAFYDRQGYGASDYFYQRIFEDIDSLSELLASMKSISAAIAKSQVDILF